MSREDPSPDCESRASPDAPRVGDRKNTVVPCTFYLWCAALRSQLGNLLGVTPRRPFHRHLLQPFNNLLKCRSRCAHGRPCRNEGGGLGFACSWLVPDPTIPVVLLPLTGTIVSLKAHHQNGQTQLDCRAAQEVVAVGRLSFENELPVIDRQTTRCGYSSPPRHPYVLGGGRLDSSPKGRASCHGAGICPRKRAGTETDTHGGPASYNDYPPRNSQPIA